MSQARSVRAGESAASSRRGVPHPLPLLAALAALAAALPARAEPACAPDAPPIYVELGPESGDPLTPNAPRSRLTIRAGGAWTWEDGAHTESGCLPPDASERFADAVVAADFRPKRREQCDAVPIVRASYHDAIGDRRTARSSPCGVTPHADVLALSEAARLLTIAPESRPLPIPKRPRTCPAGETLLTIAERSLLPPDPLLDALLPSPSTVLRIDDTGRWERHVTSGALAKGCLMPDETEALKQAVREARLEMAPPPEGKCAAVPSRATTVTTAGGTVVYGSPCGDPVHPSVYALVERAEQAVGD